MAGLSIEPNGYRMIEFTCRDGNRRRVHLGRVSQRAAEAIQVHVERLVAASITGHAVVDETSRWVANLGDVLRDRLARWELIPKRESATLGAFVDGYIKGRADTKPGTRTHWGNVRRCLVDYFGTDKPLRDVAPGDVDSFRLWLTTHEGLGNNTTNRRVGVAKQFFRAAARKRLIESNPFDGQSCAVHGNPEKFRFVTRAEADKIIEACPDAQWRLLFALSRFGGLRCPSEHLALTWADVDWERNRIRVPSPKTEHHVGGESRIIPLFPELLPYLREAFEQAEPGTEYVITRYRDTWQNLRTHFGRIIRKAGLEPWPKLFHNLRATRQTELAKNWPLHVVCSWVGNSQPVAMEHYLRVTDDDYERACSVSVRDEKAAQNPGQYTHAGTRTTSQADLGESDKLRDCKDLRICATSYGNPNRYRMGDTGFEPVTFRV